MHYNESDERGGRLAVEVRTEPAVVERRVDRSDRVGGSRL
jgi:hypothetical protein